MVVLESGRAVGEHVVDLGAEQQRDADSHTHSKKMIAPPSAPYVAS